MNVAVDAYVQDRQGQTWRVEAERDGKVLLLGRNQDRKVIDRPPPTMGVTVLEPTDDEALALVESTLGASVIARGEQGASHWTCPPLVRRLDVIHTHFFTMHGIWTKSGPMSKSLEKLLEEHRADHLTEPHVSHAWVEHRHH